LYTTEKDLKMYKHFLKRVIDLFLSFIGIIITAIPMLVIAIIVKIDSKGPAVFKIERVGKDKKPFKFYKFRTMRTDAPKDCAPRLLNEDYHTRVGKFLRRSSLDELPQLFCILKGDMSIVGPRPAGFSEEDLITARDKHNVHSVKPGLTGWAQINGRSELAKDVEKKAEFDGEYVKKMGFFFDMRCFFGTIVPVLRGDGVDDRKSKKIKKTK